jgi:CBS domain containing-hemolysin-like protein
MTILLLLLLALGFVVCSAFFSGAETGLLRLSKIKVKHWIYTRSADSEAWANWLSRPQELITTILVGNTLANVFVSSLVTAAALRLFPHHSDRWLEPAAGAVSFVSLLLFGEIIPKIYARQNPERVSSIVLRPLFEMSRFLGTPLRRFLELLSRLVPLFKEEARGRISALTLDEIRTITLDSAPLKGLEKEHQEMMNRVLALHQTSVSQIMTPLKDVDWLELAEAHSGGSKLERFIDRWVESGRTRLPVIAGAASHPGGTPPRILGYLFVKDLLALVAQDRKLTPSQIDRWVRKLPTLFPDQKISDVLDILRFGSPIACVQDRMGFPLGIVTLEDILEEIVGEILDEYDLEEKGEAS